MSAPTKWLSVLTRLVAYLHAWYNYFIGKNNNITLVNKDDKPTNQKG
jgi:hypothetical protein